MKLGDLIPHVRQLETELTAQLRAAAERQREEHDIYHQCLTFAVTAEKRAVKLEPFATGYGGQTLWTTVLEGGSDDLLVELRTLLLRTQEVAITWTMVEQAAKALRDADLLEVATECQSETEMQAKWFTTRIKTSAPQALVVAR
jgi:hypothetical protein